MNVGSVGGSMAMQSLHKTLEASEAATKGPDGDGDSDDHGVQAPAAAATPTVNGLGQQLGQVINVQA